MAETRVFSVAEANALVPTLEVRFSKIMQMRGQLKALFVEMDEAGYPATPEALTSTEGPPEVLRARGIFRAMLESLTEELAEVEALGVAIKDIDLGLCDFLGRMEDREVWLCWQFGEKSVAFWHELDSGYANRKPLTEQPHDRVLH